MATDYEPAKVTLARQTADKVQNSQDIIHLRSIEQTIIRSFAEIVKYLDGHTSKTEVINQLKSIGTPDVDKVVAAVKALDTTIKSTQAVDTSKLEKALQSLSLDSVRVTNLSDLDKRLDAVTKAVKGIKFNPVIDVKTPEAKVTVQQEGLEPLQAAMLEVVQAVRDIDIPAAEPVSAFVDEKFDEYKIEYFDEDDERPIATHYFLDGKKVATVAFSYNGAGNLVGAKKV